MKILVLNAGSGSQKCSLFEIGDALPDDPPEPLWEGEIDATAPGQPPGQMFVKAHAQGHSEVETTVPSESPRRERLERLLKTLWEGKNKVLGGPEDIAVVGHRVVHGGREFTRAGPADGKVEAAIERLAAFAPLHNASNLEGIRTARDLLGSHTPQIAVFDTAFHQTLPAAAST